LWRLNLPGKTAIVTGGNIGIGAAISRALAECGAQVALTYYSHRENAEITCQEIVDAGGIAHIYQLDATDSGQVNAVFEQAANDLNGHIDILINNAGHLVNRVQVHDRAGSRYGR
jgi:3-oxoacyl-[acyl-carrier protein] reductase